MSTFEFLVAEVSLLKKFLPAIFLDITVKGQLSAAASWRLIFLHTCHSFIFGRFFFDTSTGEGIYVSRRT